MGARPRAPVLVGGGIGGMAAALALCQAGFAVELFEQSAEIGEIGAKGVLRLVRYSFFAGRTPERFYDTLEWLYGWRVENCLA